MAHKLIKCRNCFATVMQCRCPQKHEPTWVDGCTRCKTQHGTVAYKAAPPPPPPPPKLQPKAATDEEVAATLGITPELARHLRERLGNIASAVRVEPDRVFGALRVSAIVDATRTFERCIAHAVETAVKSQ